MLPSKDGWWTTIIEWKLHALKRVIHDQDWSLLRRQPCWEFNYWWTTLALASIGYRKSIYRAAFPCLALARLNDRKKSSALTNLNLIPCKYFHKTNPHFFCVLSLVHASCINDSFFLSSPSPTTQQANVKKVAKSGGFRLWDEHKKNG